MVLSAALVGLGGAAPATAAYLPLGNITCAQPWQEVHTTSTSRGEVYHEIYGAWQHVQGWPVTSRVDGGYSSTYSEWDLHHWLYYKNDSGGKAVGSEGVVTRGMYCI